MSICIISDHIITLRQNFIHNTQHIDQVKPKYEGGGGGGGGKAPPPPGSAPALGTTGTISVLHNVRYPQKLNSSQESALGLLTPLYSNS